MGESEIFLLARKLGNRERRVFLSEACGDDPELRRNVDELLLEDDEGTHVKEWKDYQREVASLPLGSVFANRFLLIEKIGQGGMGTVYLADQLEPVHRRVAIKIIQSCFATPSNLVRFEQERQALALMDHPNIARIYDAGVYEFSRPEILPLVNENPDGLPVISYPFLVMEYIQGTPITKYCDEHQLTPRQRVELMLPVCQAIQHAHQKGIIHRDLKPSNIIVGQCDGQPVPKVIDFGVAKATEAKLTERSIFTEIGSLIGTLEYMSPEQAQLNNLDIDTRTDIYALGVILYEMLTGSVPFHRNDLEQAGLLEMLRIIKEVDPPKPSTRLSQVSSNSHITEEPSSPSTVLRSVTSDLDCIVMKALEKDREQRYGSASVMAIDLQHFLDNEPIMARPPSAGYRLKKLVHKHWGKLLVAASILLAMLIAIVGTSWGLIEANKQREQAQFHAGEAVKAAQQEREAREKAVAAEELASKRLVESNQQRKKAIDEQKNAIAISNFFLNDVIRQASPSSQRKLTKSDPNPELTVKQALYQAAGRLDGKFNGQQHIEASVRQALGESFLAVGEYEKAEKQLQAAVELREAKFGKTHDNTLSSRAWLSFAMLHYGNQQRTIDYLEKLIPDQQKRFGPESNHTVVSIKYLANAYSLMGYHDKAIPMYEELYEIRKKTSGKSHGQTLSALVDIAIARHAAGQLEQALEIYQKALQDMHKKHGPDNISTLRTMEHLARCLMDMGQYEEALPMFQKLLNDNIANYGDDTNRVLRTMCHLGWCQANMGQTKNGLELLKKTHAQQKSKFGADYIDTLNTAGKLANVLLQTGQYHEALLLHQQVAFERIKQFGVSSKETQSALKQWMMTWMLLRTEWVLHGHFINSL